MRYVYSIVRFVPDPARGEFINVGAVVGSDEAAEWDVRQVENLSRARHLDDRRALPAVSQVIDDIGHRIDAFWDSNADEDEDVAPPDLSESWLASMSASLRNVVQLTTPIPLSAETIDDAMAMVFDELIVDPLSTTLSYRRRTSAQSAIRGSYRAVQLQRGATFFEKVQLRSQGVSERLDFVVMNGHAVQLAQAWSFEVPQQRELARRIRAWGWTMSKLRESGGQLSFDGRRVDVDRAIDLEVVYVPPDNSSEAQSAFDEASAVFHDIHATAISFDDAKGVGVRAAERLAEAV